ncbi:MAG TPA: 16S rRNA pseudouridine(516) synthase [Patescibacteria group bacterium]|nr:16S rRNA pseudouridine(516) synthase [Patescibacteria group bacterium]
MAPPRVRLVKLLANLGYGSQKDVKAMIRAGRVTSATGEEFSADAQVEHAELLLDGAPLDPPAGVVLMLHKPCGYTCSTQDPGRIVYELLPPRFFRRNPVLAPVGRLDRDTSGLLLLTDDGKLLHRIISPRSEIAKTYEVTLARPLTGEEAAVFASGTLLLRSETEPLAPALLDVIDNHHARLTITEGRYHQVRRMFAAVGNHVEALHRSRIGGLSLGDLAEAQWRVVEVAELAGLGASIR